VKIKRYIAASMRAALSQVRVEQGPDAVILSTRRVDEGLEVIAAVDYDEALIAGAARRYVQPAAPAAAPEPAPAPAPVPAPIPKPAATKAPAAPVPSKAAPRKAAPAHAVATQAAASQAAATQAVAAQPATQPVTARVAPTRVVLPKAAAAAKAVPAPPSLPSSPSPPRRPAAAGRAPSNPAEASSGGFDLMQRELKDMRRLLESGFATLSWHDRRQSEPLRADVLEQLSSMDIAPDVASALAAHAPTRTKLKDTSKLPLALLLQHLPVVDGLSTVNGGIVAIVGPTGAGKTTTIAKLAARWAMRHGSQDLALVSTDSYRIGAREQLMTYARILGASMHTPNSGKELARVLDRCSSKRLVLIDTAGMGPRDVRLSEQLAALKFGAARARVMLALPAHGEVHALEEIIRAFSPIAPSACIITKVDESASLGAVISATVRNRLKIAYLCNGQRVPDDLHAAYQKRVWLVRAARKLTERSPSRGDAYLARNFGRGHAHA
jgi:flagellar biosynthesis protein FlhF